MKKTEQLCIRVTEQQRHKLTEIARDYNGNLSFAFQTILERAEVGGQQKSGDAVYKANVTASGRK